MWWREQRRRADELRALEQRQQEREREAEEAAIRNAEQHEIARRQLRYAKLFGVIGTVIGLAAIGVGVLLWRLEQDPPPPPPVADQWLDLRRQLTREGWAVRSSRQQSLRDDGRKSTVLTLGPSDPECARVRSDQVRIYDVTRGRLRETFRFQPTARGCERAFVFTTLSVGRYETDENTPDMIGAFTNDALAGLSVPVVIAWDAAANKFKIRGLLRSGAGLVRFGFADGPLRGTDKSWFEDAVRMFEEPYQLSKDLEVWGVSNAAFRAASGIYEPLVAGIYRLNAGNAGPLGKIGEPTPVVYQRAAWNLYTNNQGLLMAGNCTIRKKQLLTYENEDPAKLAAKWARRASDAIKSCDSDPSKP